MATCPSTRSLSPSQVLPHVLAAVRAWALLKAACGHDSPFFDDGPAALPVEPCAPICPVLAGAVEVAHA